VWLSAADGARITRLARTHGTTITAVACSAFARALARRLGSPEVVFGLTVSGRPPEIEEAQRALGACINTVPLRVQADDVPLGEQLAAIHRDLAELHEHARTSLVRVNTWHGLSPGTRLFDVLLVMENFPVSASLEKRGARAGIRIISDFMRAHYPLTVRLSVGAEWRVDLLFDDRRVSAEAAEWILDELCSLLGCAAHASRRTGEYRA
jgi:non-ribosomal peptide synthetase component F